MVVTSYKDEMLVYNDGLVTHEVNYKEPKKKDLFLKCSCDSEILRLTKWEDEDEVYLTVYQYVSDRYNFWERLVILFGGKSRTASIILDKKEFNKLKKF